VLITVAVFQACPVAVATHSAFSTLRGGYWWSSTVYGASDAWRRGLHYYYASFYRYSNTRELGFSVRCVKD